MSKEWTASEMGRKGGASRSPAKVEAVRRNGQLGGPKLSRRVCKRCHEHRLRPENKSGICRACLRNPARRSSASVAPVRSSSKTQSRSAAAKPRKSL